VQDDSPCKGGCKEVEALVLKVKAKRATFAIDIFHYSRNELAAY
jgi:hypothetical protein